MNLKEGIQRADRPREKLAKYGPEKLSNSELLAILLRTGTKGVHVVAFAQKLLRQFSGEGLATASFETLRKTFGLGSAKASEIIACFELGRRLLKDKKTTLLLSPEDVWKACSDIRDHKKEHFVIFYLDTRSQQIQRETISVGTLNASLVHPREVFEPAIRCNAAQVLVVHNHPSGDPEPSREDLEVTKRLVEAGKLLGIELIDHVVVCKSDYKSLM